MKKKIGEIFFVLLLVLFGVTSTKAQNTLVVKCSERYYLADALYNLKVDNVTVTTGKACKAQGADTATTLQTDTYTGNWPDNFSHAVSITFTNDVYGGSTATNRDLYIWSVTLDGNIATGTTVPPTSSNSWAGWTGGPCNCWLLGASGATLVWNTLAVTAPPVLSSLTVTPDTLTGGATADGVVTLTSAAPAGNVVVSLTTNSAQAKVPNTVTVAAGSANAHFGVSTTPSTTSPPVSAVATVGATYGGVAKTTTLTINTPPVPNPPAMTVISATVSLATVPAPPVTSHSVVLTWQPGTPPTNGFAMASFNVYRGTVAGGPYTKIANVAAPTLTYTDPSVVAATSYFYVVTTMDTAAQESGHSNEASAVIP